MNKSNITDWILAFGLFFSITAASTLASVCYVVDYQSPQACNGVLNKIQGVDTNAMLMPSVDFVIESVPPPDHTIPLLLSLALSVTGDTIKVS